MRRAPWPIVALALAAALASCADRKVADDELLVVRQSAVVVGGATTVATGSLHSCALLATGRVLCWGYGTEGSLGNGQMRRSAAPVFVTGLDDAIAIASGLDHTCALRATKEVVCWGRNYSGELGNGTRDNSSVPVPVTGLSNVTSVTAGGLFSCALREDGQVFCWGDGDYGQLGDGAAVDSLTPIAVAGLDHVVAIDAGVSHACALRSGGRDVMCWGSTFRGPVADGSATSANVPVPVTGTGDAVAVAAGYIQSCIARSNGKVSCWGGNLSGQLGNGTFAAATGLVDVTGIDDAVTVSSLSLHSCALRTSGSVACWGYGPDGQLGNGGKGNSPTAVTVTGINNAAGVSAGSVSTCLLRSTGEVVCFGRGLEGELGGGDSISSMVPAPVLDLPSASRVAAGSNHSCAVLANHDVACWGEGKDGQLGWGFAESSSSPRQVVGLPATVGTTQIAVAERHGCVIRNTPGEVLCWGGQNAATLFLAPYGLLGNGTTTGSLTPVAVSGLDDAISISTNLVNSCAARADGTVVCWGRNIRGELGDGTLTGSSVPVTVIGLDDAVEVATGGIHSCARRAAGNVVCWGFGGSGALGNGSFSDSTTPVEVSGLADAVQIVAGAGHACALRGTGQLPTLPDTGGSVVCWGDKFNGVSEHIEVNLPYPIVGLNDAKRLAAGGPRTCALRASGSVVCWGYGPEGELGNGVSGYSDVPVPVVGLTDAVDVSVGDAHTCAVRATGEVVCWGWGLAGQLGNGRAAFPSTATPLPVSGIGVDVPACTPATCGAVVIGGNGGGDDAGAIEVTFEGGVTSPGEVAVVETGFGCPPPPTGFQIKLGSSRLQSWDIDTTATFEGDFIICFPYDDEGLADEDALFLAHGTTTDCATGDWENIELYQDTENNKICGSASSFSPFAIMAPVSTPPEIHVPAALVVEATGPGGTAVAYEVAASDAEDGPLTVSCTLASGATFPIGTTPVTCTTTDSDGLVATSTFTITVQDRTGPPWSDVPDTVRASATSTRGAIVTFAAPTAVDAVDGPLPVSCTPASGSQFPINQTPVTCTAVDASGNATSTSFTVWVTYEAPTDGTFFLKPIRADGSSRFKIGRAVPVKFRLAGASANIGDLHATLTVTKLSDAVQGGADDEGDEDGDDDGFVFKYRPAKNLYAYRWKTSCETRGTYQLRADLGDGVLHQVNVSLKLPR